MSEKLNVIEQINYWIKNFQWKNINKVSDLVWLVDSYKDTLFSITWLPWAWKWWLTKKIWSNLWIKLKNKNENNSNLLELWITHEDTGIHFLYVILDCFFKEIWIKRYNEMLENTDNFLEMFSDDEKAVDFVKNILNTHESFEYEWAYLKTDIERELSKAMSSLYVRGREEWSNTNILLDWVNSFKIADILVEEMSNNRLNVNKILIKPKLWLSFQRIIKRDVIWNGKKKTKPIDVVTKFRLEEAIHLFENFTIPALYDKDAYMIDFTEKTDYQLTLKQKKEVIMSLIKSSWILFNEKKWEKFDEYLISYAWLLIEHFNHS